MKYNRLDLMIVGLLEIIDGLCTILSLAFFRPDLTHIYIIWLFKGKKQ